MAEGHSIVDLLLRDHRKVEQMLGQLDALPAGQLEDYFCTLREELVRHEVAEELILFPAFREHVPGGDAIADTRIREQAKAEETLAALEKSDMTSVSFRTQLDELRSAVLAHAQHEESEVFPTLTAHVEAAELGRLGDRYERTLASAPTHPHPHAPDTPPGNVILGPVAALIDRVRDAMRAA